MGLWDNVKKVASNTWNGAKDLVQAGAELVKDNFNEAVDDSYKAKDGSFVEALKEGASQITAPARTVANIFQEGAENIKEATPAIKQAVVDFGDKIEQSDALNYKAKDGSFVEALKESGSQFLQGAATPLTSNTITDFVVGDIALKGVSTLGELPKALETIGDMVLDDDKSFSEQRAKYGQFVQQKKDEGESLIGAHIKAIEELSGKGDNAVADVANQLLNNPLTWLAGGPAKKVLGGFVDDIAKVGAKATEGFVTKFPAASRVLSSVSKQADTLLDNKVVDTFLKGVSSGTQLVKKGIDTIGNTRIGKAGNKVSNAVQFIGGKSLGLGDVILGPVDDMLPIAKNLIKGDVATAIKEGINLTTDLVTNPVTRLGKDYFYTVARDNGIGYFSNFFKGLNEQSKFKTEYGYDINAALQQGSNELLRGFYDSQKVPTDKRLTIEQLQEKRNRGTSKLYDGIDKITNFVGVGNIFSRSATLNTDQETAIQTKNEKRGVGEWNADMIKIVGASGDIGELAKGEDLEKIQLEYGFSSSLAVQLAMKGNVTSPFAGAIAQAMAEQGQKNISDIVIAYGGLEKVASMPEVQKEIVKYINANKNLQLNTIRIINEEYSSYDVAKLSMGEIQYKALQKLSNEEKGIIDSNLYEKAKDFGTQERIKNAEGGIEKAMAIGEMLLQFTDKEKIANTLGRVFYNQGERYFASRGYDDITQTPYGGDYNEWAAFSEGLLNLAPTVAQVAINNKITGKVNRLIDAGDSALLKKYPGLNNNQFYKSFVPAFKEGALEELVFEPTLLDAPSMRGSIAMEYDTTANLLYAAVGGLAGFKGKTNRESVEEYLSNAKNRPQIMAENGIQLDQISDPEEKQALINARGQSAKGAVDLLKKAYNVNGGVETLLGSVAIAESKRVASDVIISTVSKIQNDVSNIADEKGYIDYNKVEQIFNTQTDYDNYMAGKTFQFKPEYKVQLEEYTKPLINQATTIIANYNNAAMTSKTYDEFASKINPKVTQDGIPVNTKVLSQSDTAIPSGSPQYDFSFVSTGEPSQTLFEYYKMKDNSNIWDFKNQKFKPNSGQAILEHIQSFDPQGGVLLSRKNSNIANIMVNGGSAGIDSMFDYKGNITPLGIEFLSQKNFETLDVVDQKVWLENIANASIRHQTLFTQNRIKQSRSEGIKTTKPVAIKIGDVQVNVGEKVSDIVNTSTPESSKNALERAMSKVLGGESVLVNDGDNKVIVSMNEEGNIEATKDIPEVLPEETIEAKIVEIETTVPERLTLGYDGSGKIVTSHPRFSKDKEVGKILGEIFEDLNEVDRKKGNVPVVGVKKTKFNLNDLQGRRIKVGDNTYTSEVMIGGPTIEGQEYVTILLYDPNKGESVVNSEQEVFQYYQPGGSIVSMQMKKVVDAEGKDVFDFRKLLFVKYSDTGNVQLSSTLQYHLLSQKERLQMFENNNLYRMGSNMISYNPLIDKSNGEIRVEGLDNFSLTEKGITHTQSLTQSLYKKIESVITRIEEDFAESEERPVTVEIKEKKIPEEILFDKTKPEVLPKEEASIVEQLPIENIIATPDALSEASFIIPEKGIEEQRKLAAEIDKRGISFSQLSLNDGAVFLSHIKRGDYNFANVLKEIADRMPVDKFNEIVYNSLGMYGYEGSDLEKIDKYQRVLDVIAMNQLKQEGADIKTALHSLTLKLGETIYKDFRKSYQQRMGTYNTLWNSVIEKLAKEKGIMLADEYKVPTEVYVEGPIKGLLQNAELIKSTPEIIESIKRGEEINNTFNLKEGTIYKFSYKSGKSTDQQEVFASVKENGLVSLVEENDVTDFINVIESDEIGVESKVDLLFMAVNQGLIPKKLFVYLSQGLAGDDTNLKYFDSLDQQTSVVNQANGIITKAISEVFPDLVDRKLSIELFGSLVYFWTKETKQEYSELPVYLREIFITEGRNNSEKNIMKNIIDRIENDISKSYNNYYSIEAIELLSSGENSQPVPVGYTEDELYNTYYTMYNKDYNQFIDTVEFLPNTVKSKLKDKFIAENNAVDRFSIGLGIAPIMSFLSSEQRVGGLQTINDYITKGIDEENIKELGIDKDAYETILRDYQKIYNRDRILATPVVTNYIAQNFDVFGLDLEAPTYFFTNGRREIVNRNKVLNEDISSSISIIGDKKGLENYDKQQKINVIVPKGTTIDTRGNEYINVVETDNIGFKNGKIYLEGENNRSITDRMKFKVVSRFRGQLEGIKFFDDKGDNQGVNIEEFKTFAINDESFWNNVMIPFVGDYLNSTELNGLIDVKKQLKKKKIQNKLMKTDISVWQEIINSESVDIMYDNVAKLVNILADGDVTVYGNNTSSNIDMNGTIENIVETIKKNVKNIDDVSEINRFQSVIGRYITLSLTNEADAYEDPIIRKNGDKLFNFLNEKTNINIFQYVRGIGDTVSIENSGLDFGEQGTVASIGFGEDTQQAKMGGVLGFFDSMKVYRPKEKIVSTGPRSYTNLNIVKYANGRGIRSNSIKQYTESTIFSKKGQKRRDFIRENISEKDIRSYVSILESLPKNERSDLLKKQIIIDGMFEEGSAGYEYTQDMEEIVDNPKLFYKRFYNKFLPRSISGFNQSRKSDTKEDGRFVIDMNNVGITIENKEVVSSINIIVDKIKREVFKYSNQKDIKVNTSNKKYYGGIEPTNRQIKVVNDFEKLLKKGNGTMFVAGLAGAGKTTAIGAILQVAKESSKLPDVQFRTKVKTTLSVLKNMGQQFGVELDPENFYTVDTLFKNSEGIGFNRAADIGGESEFRKEVSSMEGKIIIIDESHKLEDDMFVPIMKKLSRKNIIVFAGDPKQIGDGEEFNKQTYLNPEGENVTILNETNRGNQDINLVNKLNAYTQDVLKNSGYNGIVVTDSDSFVGYEDIADGNGIVITYENKTRNVINKMKKSFNEAIQEGDKIYSLGSTASEDFLINSLSDAPKGKRQHSNIKKLSGDRKIAIRSGDVASNYSWKENSDGSIDLVVYQTPDTTELNGDTIKKISKKYFQGKNLNVYTLGYAITSHKGAGQSFDEVTIHKEVLDKFGFDSIKYFYDSVTRARSKVYYPLNHPNLIGVTTADGNKLLAGDSKDVNFIITENRKKDKVQKLVLPQITYYSNAILGRQILDYMSDSKNKISQQKLGSITLYSNDGNQNLINEYKKLSVDLNNEYTLSDIGKLYNSLVSSGYLIDNEYINQKVNGFTFKSSKGDIIPVKGIVKKERGGLDITIDKANWIAEDINTIADDIINRIDDGFVNESVHKMQTEFNRQLTDDELLGVMDGYEYRSDTYGYDLIKEKIINRATSMIQEGMANEDIDQAIRELVEDSMPGQSKLEFESAGETIVNSIDNLYNEEC